MYDIFYLEFLNFANILKAILRVDAIISMQTWSLNLDIDFGEYFESFIYYFFSRFFWHSI